ncbi:MAG: hypothetical protein AB1522_13160 [Chloroflexota bacterium]
MTPSLFETRKSDYRDASEEYGRILTAAVISAQFRQLLLSNPAKALAAGFGGEAFQLSNEDRSRLVAIRATSLADFASQLTGYTANRSIQTAVCGD